MHITDRAEFYGSLVWIIAALAVFVFIGYVLLGYSTPGAEQLIAFLLTIDPTYIAIAGFISMFFEGLYFIGGFFPGSSLVVLVTVFAQAGGPVAFTATIAAVFIGWAAAGAVNIALAKWYMRRRLYESAPEEIRVKDRFLTTWYPVFRANYEVAQVCEGANPRHVFYSSLRVKGYFMVVITLLALIVPLLIDLTTVSNEEGYATLVIVATITLVVGVVKMKRAIKWT